MAVVTGHTCNATGFKGSLPKEERQRDCPACQRLAKQGFSPAVRSAMSRFEGQLAAERQLTLDMKHLRFYASLFREKKWETDVIHWSVFEATLNEIADRLACCPKCKGVGGFSRHEADVDGEPCAACAGTGMEFPGNPRTEKCEECDGTGKATADSSVSEPQPNPKKGPHE